jgi:hypothetical protein
MRSISLKVLCLLIPVIYAAAASEKSGEETSGRFEEEPVRAAVVADLSGEVWVHPPDSGRPEPASLGRRLHVGETVETADHARATLFLAGGQLLEILEGSRIRISRDLASGPDEPRRKIKLADSSLKVLEKGVWILSGSEGSLLIGSMRGGDDRPAAAPGQGVPVLLSPRDENVMHGRPGFHWAGSVGPAYIKISAQGGSIWKSPEVVDSTYTYPDSEPPLSPGITYAWWIESTDTGAALTLPASFHVATLEGQTATEAFEATMIDMQESGASSSLTTFLRCAYYRESGAWTPLLAAASPATTDDESSSFVTRAREIAIAGLGLDDGEAQDLIEQLRPGE